MPTRVTKDLISRSTLMIVLDVLDLAPAATLSTQPLDKLKFRRRAVFAADLLREGIPADAFQDGSLILEAANDNPDQDNET